MTKHVDEKLSDIAALSDRDLLEAYTFAEPGRNVARVLIAEMERRNLAVGVDHSFAQGSLPNERSDVHA